MRNIEISRDNARSRVVERCMRTTRNVIVGGVLLAAVPPPTQSASTTCRSVGNLRLPSPDLRREMLLYVRICGEETSGEVAIVRTGAPVPDGSGNIDVPGHPIRVSGRWTSDTTVLLAVPGTATLPPPQSVDGVKVTFVRLVDPDLP